MFHVKGALTHAEGQCILFLIDAPLRSFAHSIIDQTSNAMEACRANDHMLANCDAEMLVLTY